MVPAGNSTATMPPSTRKSDCPQYGTSTASNDCATAAASDVLLIGRCLRE